MSNATDGASQNNISSYRGCLHKAAVRIVCPMRKLARRIHWIPATSLNEEPQEIAELLRLDDTTKAHLKIHGERE